MKHQKLSEIFQNLDDNLIARASKRRRLNKKALIRICALCACFAVVLTLSIRFTQKNPSADTPVKPDTNSTLVSKPSSVSKLVAGAIYPTTPDLPEKYTAEQWREYFQYQKTISELETSTQGLRDYVSSLSRQLLSNDSKNSVISPANIYFMLTLLADISDGNTQKQIMDLLGYDNRDELVENAKKLWQKLYVDSLGNKSILANSLWLSNELEYNQSTVERLRDELYASTFTGDFSSIEYTELLQQWLNEQTGGLLQDSVKEICFTPNDVFSLASTVYYKSDWVNSFSEKDTKQDTFHGKDHDKTVDFMNQTNFGNNYYYSDDFSATEISLDAGRMIFILPDEGVSVSQVLKSNSLFDLISDPLTFNKKSLRINLSVPKFDINSSLSMDKSLKALGVTDAFEISRADFSPIFTQTQSALTEFKHAARVKIDEEGCEAAAYSFITSTGSSAPPDDEIDFVLNRPFIFVITGADSLPRFIGTVNNL